MTRFVFLWTLLLAFVPRVTSAATWYAKTAASGSGNCSSWSNACTLPTAIAAASNGDAVWAKKGTYTLPSAIVLEDGVKIIGGFAGTETLASQSNPIVNETILRGGGGSSPECNGPMPIVYSAGNSRSAVLRGFILENGDSPGELFIYCGGGAMRIVDSSPSIVNCAFRNNYGSVGGAVAVYNPNSFPVFTNCTFYDNGYKLTGYDPQTQEPLYSYTNGGGAAILFNGSADFHNCLFHNNHAWSGGAVYVEPYYGTWANFTGCTITENFARNSAGGVSIGGNNGRFLNSIIRNNHVEAAGPSDISSFDNLIYVWFSNISGSWPNGIYNVNADPLFFNVGLDDYRIKYQSPSRQKAITFYTPSDSEDLDWDGDTYEKAPLDLGLKTRVVQVQVDQGAYEVSCAKSPILDCNLNSIPDACDILEGTSLDCNANAVPDSCDLAADPTKDCFDGNGVPDLCQPSVPKGACCIAGVSCSWPETACRCNAQFGGGVWHQGKKCDQITCGGLQE